MAKNVFKPYEIKSQQGDKITLPLLRNYAPEKEEEEEKEEEYTGPTADDLRREAEAFKTGWEIEKQHLLEEAQKSADEIVKKAEDAAFAEVKRQTDQAQIIKTDAEKEAESILKKAQDEAQSILNKAHIDENNIKTDAYNEGLAEGKNDGYNSGRKELDHLVGRVHKIIESVMNRREEILRDTEQQIVDLVLLMTRKVVKVISETQKDVVLQNILAALKKVKTRSAVTLRVNVDDLDLTTEHLNEFVKSVENVEGITVIEDSSIDRGGCIVETDFGAVDARISSQLTELENRILELSPERATTKDDDEKSGAC